MQYSAVQYSIVQYSTVQYSTVQCITIRYITLHCIALHYTTLHYLREVVQHEHRAVVVAGAGAGRAVRAAAHRVVQHAWRLGGRLRRVAVDHVAKVERRSERRAAQQQLAARRAAEQ